MSSSVMIVLVVIVVLALVFDFINGFHDTANCVATTISTRALTPAAAIAMAAVLNFVGALVSQHVAKTISSGIVVPSQMAAMPEYIVIAALLAAIIWNLVTWWFGIPSSSSHALIGSLVGSAIAYSGSGSVIQWHGVLHKIVIPLFVSPVSGFLLGFALMKLMYLLLRKATAVFAHRFFARFQILSGAFMAFTHGMNDAQKSMGIITFAMIGSGILAHGSGIPLWVILTCAVAMALGTAVGGWRIIKTMGFGMSKIDPVQGFSAQTTAAVVIGVASQFGQPVSTTHVITSSVMGVGAAKRLSAVRWILARDIVWAWLLTIPLTALMGGLLTLLLRQILK